MSSCQKGGPTGRVAKISTRNVCPMRDKTLPKRVSAAHLKAAFPEIGERDSCRLLHGLKVPILGAVGPPRSSRSIPGQVVRRHKPVRDPREESHNHAERYPAHPTHPRGNITTATTQQHINRSFSGPPQASQGKCLEELKTSENPFCNCAK